MSLKKFIPASGVIIDRAKGKVHIINPGKVKNIAQGFYDQYGFHPIRASADYDPDRLNDDTEGSYRRKKRVVKKKKATAKKKATKKRRK